MENNKATPQEEFDAQEDFKNMMAQAFAKQIQGVTIDEDGFICIPKSYVEARRQERMKKDFKE